MATIAAMALASMSASARADCFDDAGARHGVNPLLLRAIAWHESGMNPDAIGHNRNGSQDLGLMQVNTVHLRALSRHGIGRRDLMFPCHNVHVGAWLLSVKIAKHGNTWRAVGAYHSETPSLSDGYARKVQAVLTGWGAYRPSP